MTLDHIAAGVGDDRDTDSLPTPSSALVVTDRDVQILRWLADGLYDIDIARKLYLTERSVKSILHRLYAKLDVSRRVAAVAAAYDRNLLRPPGNATAGSSVVYIRETGFDRRVLPRSELAATTDAEVDVWVRCVGATITTLRLQRRATLAAIADRLGCSTSFMWKIEQGQRRLTVERLLIVANALGTTPMDIIQRAHELASRAGTRQPTKPTIEPIELADHRDADTDAVGREARPCAAR